MITFTQIVAPATYTAVSMHLNNIILGSDAPVSFDFMMWCIIGVGAVVAACFFGMLFLLKKLFSKPKK